MQKRVWIFCLLFLFAAVVSVNFVAQTAFAAAPDVVTQVVPTTTGLAVTLTWTNPASVDFTGTMVRYSTTAFPTSTSDGTLVEDVAGAVSGTSTTTLSSLTSGTIYYFSLFSHNVAPEYSAAVNTQQLVMPNRFTEDFESDAVAAADGQNGWDVVAGTWNIIDTSGEQTLKSGTDSLTFDQYRVLNGGTVATYSNQMIRADWKGSAASGAGQLFLRAQSASADSGGYVLTQSGGFLRLNFKTTTGSSSGLLASGAFTPSGNTWYTYEFSVVNNASGIPVLSAYAWARGAAKPSTPTVTYTELFPRFAQGVFSVGKSGTTAAEYDNITYYGMIGNSSIAVTPGDEANTITWTNPTFATYSGTVVRVSTTATPASVTDGTLVADVAGASGATSSTVHSGLTNGTLYYYALFPYDSGAVYGTPVYISEVAEPLLLSETFDALTLGSVDAQNGWDVVAGTWTVADVSVDRLLSATDATSYLTNMATNGDPTSIDQILSYRFQSDTATNSAGYSWLRHQANNDGYLIWHNGNVWKISYQSGATFADLASAATTTTVTMQANVWFNVEASVIDDDAGLPTFKLFVWKQGTEKPLTPTLTAADSFGRFTEGTMALGRNTTVAASYYDSVSFSASLPVPPVISNLILTSPAAAVVAEPDTATLAITDEFDTFYIPYIQTSTTLNAVATIDVPPVGGGVRFILNEGLAGEQTINDIAGPDFTASFVGLAKGEYTLDAYEIIEDGVTLSVDPLLHDLREQIGIGDIITVIGDSTSEGSGGTIAAGTVVNWLEADPISLSVDHRNFPQHGAGNGDSYKEAFLTDLNDKLTAYYGYPVFLMNEAWFGLNSSSYVSTAMGAGWEARELALAPTKWLLALGNGDSQVSRSAATYQTNMETLITTLMTTYGASADDIYIPYPFYDNRDPYLSFLSTYPAVIDDMRTDLGLGGGADLFYTFENYKPAEYSSIHPNATGYAHIARLWELAIMKPALTAPIATGRSVALSWDDLAVLEPTIVGYNVHYGTSAGNLDQTAVLGDVTSTSITNLNWNTTYYFSVEGFDNDAFDVSYTDDSDTLSVTTDAGSSGFTPSAISGDTTEASGTATFTVVLTSQPVADVTIAVSSSNTAEGTVSPASLTFTSVDWNTAAAHIVTLTGVNDDVDDGNVAYSAVLAAAVSTDVSYSGVNPADVSVTNTDNDSSGFTISAISGDTTEAGGTATFTVALTSQPTEDVVVAVSSSDTTEGTVSPASLTFTAANWSDGAAHTVTATGVNDDVDDGNIGYNIVLAAAVTGDGTYTGLNPADVSVTNTDNDSSGFTISAISGDTTEAGGTATFTVALTSEPTEDVVVAVSSNDTTEGTVSPASLTFTAANWSDGAAHTVTATGVNDDVDDGNIGYNIVLAAAVTGDGTYTGLNPADVSATNTDNDTANVIVTQSGGQTTVTEAGGTDSYTLVLTSEPTLDVVITLTASSQLSVDVNPVTFTSLNWDTPQTITVSAVNDDVDEADAASAISHAAVSSDPVYSGIAISSVNATVTDNDTAGLTVSAISGNTTEAGGTATFTVVLTSEPTANVVVGVSSSDTTEGTVAPASLTFTSLNWDDAQTVTVTGVNDDVDDGSIVYTIVLASAVSDDAFYSALNPADVSVTNTDNDTVGVTVTESAATTFVEEDGATDSYTVVLTSEPTADVVVALSFTGEEISLSAASLTFTSLDWDTPQTVTVTAVDDNSHESDETVVISHDPTSADGLYDVLSIASVTVTVDSEDATGSNKTPSGGGGSSSTQTKSINIILPKLDDSYSAGARVAVEWTWVGTIPFVNIDLRLSSGSDWISLSTNQSNSGLISVTLPSEASTSAQVRVVGTDLATTLATGTSEVFTITAATDTDEDTTTDTSTTTDTVDEVAARVDALPASVDVHGLVKLRNDGDTETQADSAVYYIGADGRRHAFPNDKVYFTWFCDFSDVQIISADDLASIPLGSNVTYRPGTRLVKFITDLKVYAVDQFGILRWVTSEALAVELYGADWATMIDDISDAFFGNYAFGTPIESASDYNQTTEEESVTYPSDTFVIPGYEGMASDGLVCPA